MFIDKYWWWFVPSIALIAYGIIMALGAGQPVWFDEGYSILLAKHSFAELWSLTAVDAHPPLFYVLLKIWGGIFGFSEFALRSFSAVAMASAIALAVSLIRKLFSTKVALVAMPFLLFAPFLLRYGYEIRMYALATLIGVGATYVMVKAYAQKSVWLWTLYAALVAAGMFTLYLMVAVWLAHAVWLFVTSLRSKVRPFWKWQWWYAFAGAVVLFAAYIPTFLHQLLNSALPGMGSPITATKLVDIASSLALYTNEWKLGGWLSVLLVGLVAVLALLGVRVYRQLTSTERSYYRLFLTLAVVPVLFFALSSLPPRDPIFIIRYMAHVSMFVYALVAVTIGLAWVYMSRKQKKAGLTKGVVMFTTILTLLSFGYGVTALAKAGNFNVERMQQPLTKDVRSIAACGADTTVIASDPYTYIDSVYYFDHCNLRFFAKETPEYKGGYAMLHNAPQRIDSSAGITAPRLVVLGWVGQNDTFVPDSRYQLDETAVFDKQQVRVYKLSAE